MRILMISDVYFPRVNGVSTSIRTFRREMEKLGHRVTLIAPQYGEETDDESWIVRVPARKVIVDPEDRMMSYRAAVTAAGQISGEAFDILHIQTPFVAHYAGMSIAKRLGLPVVLSYHTYFEEYLYHYVKFLPKRLLRFAVRHFSRHQCAQVDAVVVPSTVFRDVLRDYGVTNSLHVNPTGIDLEKFSDGDGGCFRIAKGIEPHRPVLLFIGRLVHEKNIGFLLDVVARVRPEIPDVLFIMAGEGPAKPALAKQVRRLGLEENTRFVGNISYLRGLLDCYAAADAFIFASRTETQGLVLLEAMALGVPVIATARMGTRDILAPERGAVVVDEDVNEFAAAVVRLLQTQEIRASIGQDGRDYVREWSAEAMARRMAGLYLKTVNRGQTLGSMR